MSISHSHLGLAGVNPADVEKIADEIIAALANIPGVPAWASLAFNFAPGLIHIVVEVLLSLGYLKPPAPSPAPAPTPAPAPPTLA